MKPKTSTVVRLMLLVIALVNLALSTIGIVPEDIVGSSQAYEMGSVIVTAIISVINMWTNNSFTKEAIMADGYLEKLKAGRRTTNSNRSVSPNHYSVSTNNKTRPPVPHSKPKVAPAADNYITANTSNSSIKNEDDITPCENGCSTHYDESTDDDDGDSDPDKSDTDGDSKYFHSSNTV